MVTDLFDQWCKRLFVMSREYASPARTETSLDDNIMPPVFSAGDFGKVAIARN